MLQLRGRVQRHRAILQAFAHAVDVRAEPHRLGPTYKMEVRPVPESLVPGAGERELRRAIGATVGLIGFG